MSRMQHAPELKRIWNPPNPFISEHRELLEQAPIAEMEVYEDASRSVLSHNDSPDIGFRWSVNPYRGCFHACAYCYARPSHEYLGLGAGTDFERKIFVKRRAPYPSSSERDSPGNPPAATPKNVGATIKAASGSDLQLEFPW